MTDKEYKVVVKLLIEELEKCRDEIFAKDVEIERLKKAVEQNSYISRQNRKNDDVFGIL